MSSYSFDKKWKQITNKTSNDERGLYVPPGCKPRTQRQMNLYWYYQFIHSVIKEKQYKRGLELGCGRGTMSLFLHTYNHLDVTLLDNSPEALHVAKDNFSNIDARGTFVLGSCEQLPFADNSFDVVYSIGLLEHLEDYQRTLAESYRVLTPGGVMISLNIPKKWSLQILNNLYKRFLTIFFHTVEVRKDYFRNADTPDVYKRKAEESGFSDVFFVSVNPFPLFTPMPIPLDTLITKIYRLFMKIRSLYLKYPFETTYTFSQAHFLVGYKKI